MALRQSISSVCRFTCSCELARAAPAPVPASQFLNGEPVLLGCVQKWWPRSAPHAGRRCKGTHRICSEADTQWTWTHDTCLSSIVGSAVVGSAEHRLLLTLPLLPALEFSPHSLSHPTGVVDGPCHALILHRLLEEVEHVPLLGALAVVDGFGNVRAQIRHR